MKRIVLAAVMFIIVLLFGCTTAAQRQASFIRENSEAVKQKVLVCSHKVETNPDYQKIAIHMPLVITATKHPTLLQLADNGMPSDEDIKAIISLHNEAEACRSQAIEDIVKFLPGIIPMLTQLYHGSDLVMVDLIQQKITWGESSKRRMALVDDYTAKVQAFSEQLDRDLAASHNAELAQRQAALNALSQWAYQQQVLWQNQQLINTLNRPTFTHCTTNGNMVNCSSY